MERILNFNIVAKKSGPWRCVGVGEGKYYMGESKLLHLDKS